MRPIALGSRGVPRALRTFVAESPAQRRAIARSVVAFAGSLPRGSRVLDAGSGGAPYSSLFSHCDHVTHDWPNSPHAAAGSADVVADLAELPAEAGPFDAVLCTEVLEHVADPLRALERLVAVLRPGGRILVTVPFAAALHEEPYDFQRLTNHGLRRVLERAGFDAVVVWPLSGWWSTIAHLLRFAGEATRPPGRQASPPARAAALTMLALSSVLAALAPALDRLDERRALPVGWAAEARRPAAREA